MPNKRAVSKRQIGAYIEQELYALAERLVKDRGYDSMTALLTELLEREAERLLRGQGAQGLQGTDQEAA